MENGRIICNKIFQKIFMYWLGDNCNNFFYLPSFGQTFIVMKTLKFQQLLISHIPIQMVPCYLHQTESMLSWKRTYLFYVPKKKKSCNITFNSSSWWNYYWVKRKTKNKRKTKKSGIDVMDGQLERHTTHRRTSRWPLAFSIFWTQ